MHSYTALHVESHRYKKLHCSPPLPSPFAVTRKKTVIKKGTFTVIHLLRCSSERQRRWVYTVVQCNKASSCSLEGVGEGWGEGVRGGGGGGGMTIAKPPVRLRPGRIAKPFNRIYTGWGGGGVTFIFYSVSLTTREPIKIFHVYFPTCSHAYS
jgi:hypothetical protein